MATVCTPTHPPTLCLQCYSTDTCAIYTAKACYLLSTVSTITIMQYICHVFAKTVTKMCV